MCISAHALQPHTPTISTAARGNEVPSACNHCHIAVLLRSIRRSPLFSRLAHFLKCCTPEEPMKNSLIRVCGAGAITLLFLTALEATEAPRETTQAVRSPRDARQLSNRTDLTDLFKQQPEIRIIVGMQTPEERGPLVVAIPDRTREQSVSTRQMRVLDRVQGLNIMYII